MRVGLTGLGVVFLITLGAAFAFNSATDQAGALESKAGEPLAQLGVAPGPEKDQAVEPPASPESPPASGTTVVPPPVNAAAPDAGMAVFGAPAPISTSI